MLLEAARVIWPASTRRMWPSFLLTTCPSLRVAACHYFLRLIGCDASVFPLCPTLFTGHFPTRVYPTLSANLGCSVFLRSAFEFSCLCIFASKTSSFPVAAAPAPKFPQHSLCTAGFPSLLCFTVMRLPVWLSLSILKSLRLETSNDSSQRYCLH